MSRRRLDFASLLDLLKRIYELVDLTVEDFREIVAGEVYAVVGYSGLRKL